MVNVGIIPFRENSHGRAGIRTRDLIISSQILWPRGSDVERRLVKWKDHVTARYVREGDYANYLSKPRLRVF